jgi:hypothetical protein
MFFEAGIFPTCFAGIGLTSAGAVALVFVASRRGCPIIPCPCGARGLFDGYPRSVVKAGRLGAKAAQTWGSLGRSARMAQKAATALIAVGAAPGTEA